jgi:hypothetical protein
MWIRSSAAATCNICGASFLPKTKAYRTFGWKRAMLWVACLGSAANAATELTGVQRMLPSTPGTKKSLKYPI